MHQRISKKIFIYLFIFFTLVTVNNIRLSKLDFLKINDFKILGLNELERKKFQKDIKYLQNKNLFFLNKKEILSKINSNKVFQEVYIFKNYPSNLEIIIEKANFLAITKKDNQDYYIGSNGKLIQFDNSEINLPFIFGNIDAKDFLQFKIIMDRSSFDFNQIKNLYYFKSKRWDIETKDGLIIKLPLKQIESALDILVKLSKKSEFKNLRVIDLRQNNQVIING